MLKQGNGTSHTLHPTSLTRSTLVLASKTGRNRYHASWVLDSARYCSEYAVTTCSGNSM